MSIRVPRFRQWLAAVETRAKRQERKKILNTLRAALQVGDTLETVVTVLGIDWAVRDE